MRERVEETDAADKQWEHEAELEEQLEMLLPCVYRAGQSGGTAPSLDARGCFDQNQTTPHQSLSLDYRAVSSLIYS